MKDTDAITHPPLTAPNDPRVAGLRVVGRSGWFRFDELFKTRQCVTVGRTRHRDIQIAEPSVSTRHALVSRTDDGQFKIEDWESTNGIFIAPRGGYSEWIEVEDEVLQLGMLIRLGRVTLAPVDSRGYCPMMISRYSELFRVAVKIYGNVYAAAKKLGRISRTTIARKLRLFARSGA